MPRRLTRHTGVAATGRILWAATGLLVVATAGGLGCGPAMSVGEIPQGRDRFPPRVQRVLVMPFEGDPVWGPRAAEFVADGLRQQSDEFGDLLLKTLTIVRPRGLATTTPEAANRPDPQAGPTGTRRPAAGDTDEQRALAEGRVANAQAVVYGNVQVTRIDIEGPVGPPADSPQRLSVVWRAVVQDVETRQVYARLTLTQTAPPADTDLSGRPRVDELDRRLRRGPRPDAGRQLNTILAEMADFLVAELEPQSRVERGPLAGPWHIYGPQALEALAAGDTERAFAIWRRALRLAPDDPACLHNLGVVDEHRGDATAALRGYEAALANDPDNTHYNASRDRVFGRTRAGPAAVLER